MLDQTASEVSIDLAVDAGGAPKGEVIRPSSQTPVPLSNQHRNRLKALVTVGHFWSFRVTSPVPVGTAFASQAALIPLLESPLVRLHAEQAIYMVNSFQFTRSAMLTLATDRRERIRQQA
jgi:hypothetical protein